MRAHCLAVALVLMDWHVPARAQIVPRQPDKIGISITIHDTTFNTANRTWRVLVTCQVNDLRDAKDLDRNEYFNYHLFYWDQDWYEWGVRGDYNQVCNPGSFNGYDATRVVVTRDRPTTILLVPQLDHPLMRATSITYTMP